MSMFPVDYNHYVYLFRQRSTDTYKVGITQYIKSRNKEFIFHQLDVALYAIFTPLSHDQSYLDYTRKKAFKLETFLCNQFKEKRIIGREWFQLSEADVLQIENYIDYLVELTEDNDYMRVKLVKPVAVVMPQN